jgi:sugar diacid utilization regulator
VSDDDGGALVREPSGPVTALVQLVVTDLRLRFEDLEQTIAHGAAKDLPALASEELMDEVNRTTRRFVERVFAQFEDPEQPVEAPATPLKLATTLARREFPVTTLIELFRRGQTIFFEAWIDALSNRASDRIVFAEALTWSYRRFHALVNVTLEQAVQAYLLESERWRGRALAARARLVQEILDGAATDPKSAALVLNHNFELPQLALILSASASSSEEASSTLPELAHELAQRLGAQRALTIPASTSVIHAWVACSSAPDLTRLDAVAIGPQTRVALGSPGMGLGGFIQSHRQARWAHQLALLAWEAPCLISYAAAAAMSLIREDPEQLRAFVRHELGPLAARDAGMERLRGTLVVLLQEALNATRAAGRLSMHKNTVIYRLRRAESLRGRPVNERRFELELALRIVDTFGEQVLL